jgi:uncharacterized OB-fold protein
LTQGRPPPPPRPLPALDKDSEFFWKGGAGGRLLICRCEACGRYQHPPSPYCPGCGAGKVSPAAVSGRARVATYTVNYQTWVPGLETPYVFAAVELVEQPELYVLTNIVDCPVEDVRIGLEVEVVFEAHGEIYLPMFRPSGASHA